MKNIILLLLVFAALQSCSTRDTVYALDPQQSMLIFGKGPGQDAAINPYEGQDCRAIVKNLGEGQVGVRVQYK